MSRWRWSLTKKKLTPEDLAKLPKNWEWRSITAVVPGVDNPTDAHSRHAILVKGHMDEKADEMAARLVAHRNHLDLG